MNQFDQAAITFQPQVGYIMSSLFSLSECVRMLLKTELYYAKSAVVDCTCLIGKVFFSKCCTSGSIAKAVYSVVWIA